MSATEPRIERTAIAQHVPLTPDSAADVLVHQWSDGHTTCSIRPSDPAGTPSPWGAEQRMAAR